MGSRSGHRRTRRLGSRSALCIAAISGATSAASLWTGAMHCQGLPYEAVCGNHRLLLGQRKQLESAAAMEHSGRMQSTHMCRLLPAALRTCRPAYQAACAARLACTQLDNETACHSLSSLHTFFATCCVVCASCLPTLTAHPHRRLPLPQHGGRHVSYPVCLQLLICRGSLLEVQVLQQGQ